MAVVAVTGAESASATVENVSLSGGSVPATISTANPRTVNGRGGTRHYRCTGTATDLPALDCTNISTVTTSVSSSFYFKFSFQVSALPSVAAVALCQSYYWHFDGSLNTIYDSIMTIRLTSAGKLRLYDEATSVQLGSDSTLVVSTGVWYNAVLFHNRSTGVATAWAAADDGTAPSQFATGTSTNGVGSASAGFFLGWCAAPGVTSNLDIDDAIFDDANQPHQDTVVLYHKPLSDNARTGWTAGAGGTTSLFDALDNLPPVGVANASATNTSQIKDTTSSTTDAYDANMESWTDKGMGSADTITATQAVSIIGNSTTTSRNIGLQVVSNPVITEAVTGTPGTAMGTFATGWLRQATAWSSSAVTSGTRPVARLRKATATTDATSACALGLNSVVQVSRSLTTYPIRAYRTAVSRSYNY